MIQSMEWVRVPSAVTAGGLVKVIFPELASGVNEADPEIRARS